MSFRYFPVPGTFVGHLEASIGSSNDAELIIFTCASTQPVREGSVAVPAPFHPPQNGSCLCSDG